MVIYGHDFSVREETAIYNAASNRMNLNYSHRVASNEKNSISISARNQEFVAPAKTSPRSIHIRDDFAVIAGGLFNAVLSR